MKNPFVQGLLLVGIFFFAWWALCQVDWVNLLRVKPAKETADEKLGKLIFSAFEKKVVKDKSINLPLDSLKQRLCRANGLGLQTIKLCAVHSSEVNAFALPFGFVMINLGIINECEDEAALAGVLAHEIAHVQQNHVTKKLIKELGAAVVANLLTNGAGGEVVREAIQVLTSRAYDRSLEAEADELATTYLCKAGIDAKPFAKLMKRLEKDDIPAAFKWISTHPESEERAAQIIREADSCTNNYQKVLAKATWEKLKANSKVYDSKEYVDPFPSDD
jgi:predicted Zn-dependent protease